MVGELYLAIVKAFKETVEPYEGKFIEEANEWGDRAEFTSPNSLSKWLNESKEGGSKCEYVNKTRIIPCTISVQEYDNFVSVGVEEATFEYIGGVSTLCDNVNEAVKFLGWVLERYNFRKKKWYEQLSLF